MLQKCLSLTLTVSLLLTLGGNAYARPKGEEETQRIEKVKAVIKGLGTGPTARVSLKLQDRRKVEGYVSAAGEDTFEVTDPKTGEATTVTYPQVGTSKGNNLSQGAKIVILVGASVALSVLVYKYGRGRRRVRF